MYKRLANVCFELPDHHCQLQRDWRYQINYGTEFTSYFQKYKYDAIKQKISSFATKGHHFSPDYGQNAVEWLNYLTKEEIDTESNVKKSHKTVPIITCFKKLNERSLRLYSNAIKTIYGEGPYFLSPAYEHLKCTYDQFKDLTKPEKENLLRRMFTYTPNPKVLLNNGYLLDDDEIEPQKADLLKVSEVKDTDNSRLSKQCFRRHEKLPFSPTDFKLTSKFGIPEESVSDIFERARKLLDEPGAITKAASSDEYMRTVKSSYGPKPHLVTPSSRNQYLLTCPCKTYNMFDLCRHALATSADIGIAMEYFMEVVKKFEQKKQKKVSSYSITNAYNSTLKVSQLGKKKNEISKPNSKRLKKTDGFFMKTTGSAGSIETSENYNTRTPSSNCSESSAEISDWGHHYLVTKDHQLFHKIQQQKIVKYWDIKPVSKEIKLQLHRFSFLLKATP